MAAFAAAVTRLLRAPADAASLGARAAELVRTRFGWERAADQFADACMLAVDASARHVPTLVRSP